MILVMSAGTRCTGTTTAPGMGLVSEQMSGRLALGMALVGGAYTGYLVVRDAEYFRLRHVHIMGNETLTRQDVHYLLALPTR